MRKLLIVGVVLLVLVGLGAFALINLNTFLQNNREWLAEKASATLGRSVSFDEVGVSFSSGLGARVSNVAIGDDPAFSKEPFLQVGRANVVLKIVPALTGRYEISRVVLEAPQVTVVKTAGGFNFDSIGKTDGAAQPERSGSDAAAPSADAALPLLVSVLQISDGRLRFIDRTSSPSSDLLVEQVDFSASDVGFDEAVGIEFAAAVLGFAEQNLKVEGTVGPLGSPAAAPKAPIDLGVTIGPVVIDRIKKLPVVGDSIPSELSSADPITVDLKVTGKLDAPALRASMDATSAGLRFGDVFAKPSGTRLAFEADVAQSGELINVGSLALRLADATIRGEGTIGTGSSTPIDFEVRGADVPLEGWGRFFAAAKDVDVGGVLDLEVRAKGSAAAGTPALNGTFALKDVRATQPGGGVEISGLSTKVVLDGDRVMVPPTSFKVGGEPVTMSATVTSLKKLTADFTVSSPQLKLAALGAGGEGVKKDEVLRDLDVKGSVRDASGSPAVRATVVSSAGSVRDVDYGNLAAEVGLVGDKATLSRVTVKAFDGLISGAGSYDMSKSKPGFNFRGRLSNLDVASIVKFLGIGATVKMTGALDGDLTVAGSGSELEQIKQTMAGNGALQVKRGVLKDVNIAESVLSSVTGVPGLSALVGPKVRGKYPELFESSDTSFEELGGKVDIGSGRADLKELALAARDYRLSGQGTVGFDSAVNIAASFIASERLTQDLLGGVREAKYLLDTNGRFEVPLRIAGSLPNVRPQPDTQYVGQEADRGARLEGARQGARSVVRQEEVRGWRGASGRRRRQRRRSVAGGNWRGIGGEADSKRPRGTARRCQVGEKES